MFDIAIVGSGIIGLAHAYAAARRGLRVVVIDREREVTGASIRNFGLINVTGQGAGETWERAVRTREIWAEVAPEAGIPVLQTGMLVAGRLPEAANVLEALSKTREGELCEMVTPRQVAETFPMVRQKGLTAGLWSPYELRVEARPAIALLSKWLARAWGVRFMRPVQVLKVEPPRLETSAGIIRASRCVVCPGDDLRTLYSELFLSFGIIRTKLHMMRLSSPGWRSRAVFMSDLTMARYRGYSELPEAKALMDRLQKERSAELDNGVHLIVTQSHDDSLVVGDSHTDGDTPDPFQPEHIDRLIRSEAARVLDLGEAAPVERWVGTYTKAPNRDTLVEVTGTDSRLVVTTSGSGMSTCFAVGEEVIADLVGEDAAF